VSIILELTTAEAGQRAIEFLMQDLDIPIEDQEWFSILGVRAVGQTWHVVEIGVEGLPDQWVLQVYDTGECDPNYTFRTPVQATEADTGLADMPEAIAQILTTERQSH
jgi:hypothetical protein